MFPVAEHFVSINGESTRAGELAVFIRFRGCNLDCAYCDTKWANCAEAPAEMMSADEITAMVIDTGIKNVTLTGGEPLLQDNISELTDRLIESGCRVEIETNGSLPICSLALSEKRPVFTLDYKLPCSGMEEFMYIDNYEFLCAEDSVKFVAETIDDLKRASEIIKKYDLTSKCNVYFSPVFGKADIQAMVSFMIENRLNGIRLQLQLHKYIWDPQMRGV